MASTTTTTTRLVAATGGPSVGGTGGGAGVRVFRVDAAVPEPSTATTTTAPPQLLLSLPSGPAHHTLMHATWSFDTKYFATCGSDNAVSVHDAASGKIVDVIPAPKSMDPASNAARSQINVVEFGPRRDSRYLYFGGTGRQVHIWDRWDRVSAETISGLKNAVTSLAVNVDETTVGSASAKGEVLMYTLKTKTPSTLRSPFTQNINNCAFSPFKKSIFAAAGDEGVVALWDLNHSSSPIFTIKDAHRAPIHGLAFAPCMKSLFATAGLDRRLKVFNKDEKGKLMFEFVTDSPVSSMAVNGDFLIAVGTLGGKVQLYDIRSTTPCASFAVSQGTSVSCLAFEPPEWAVKTAHREAGSSKAQETTKPQTTSAPSAPAPVTAATVAPVSGTIASLRERIAAVQGSGNVMDMFSPVKPVNERGMSDAKINEIRKLVEKTSSPGTASTFDSAKKAEEKVLPSKPSSSALNMFSPIARKAEGQEKPPTSRHPLASTPIYGASPSERNAVVPSSAQSSTATNHPPSASTTTKTTSSVSLARLQESLRALKASEQSSPAAASIVVPETPRSPLAVKRSVSAHVVGSLKKGDGASLGVEADAGGGVLGRGTSKMTPSPSSASFAGALAASTAATANEGLMVVSPPRSPPKSPSSPPVQEPPIVTPPPSSSQQVADGGVAAMIIKGVIDDALMDFRMQVRSEIRDMHVELLREFMNQKVEIEELFQMYSPSVALMDEVKALREENARLRCGFIGKAA